MGHSAGQLASKRSVCWGGSGGETFKGRKKTNAVGEMDWTRFRGETVITFLGQLRHFNVIKSDIKTFLFIFSDVIKLLLRGDYS